MSLPEDRVPLAALLPTEEDEPLDAARHALTALAAGVASMQLMVAAAHGHLVPTAFWAVTCAAMGAAVVAWRLSDRSRWPAVGGGACSVAVWLALALQAPGPTMPVALAMAALSAAMTRHLAAGGGPAAGAHPEAAVPSEPWEPRESRAWIDDDREGFLPAQP